MLLLWIQRLTNQLTSLTLVNQTTVGNGVQTIASDNLVRLTTTGSISFGMIGGFTSKMLHSTVLSTLSSSPDVVPVPHLPWVANFHLP